MTLFGVLARIAFTAPMVWLTWRLLRAGVTAPKYMTASVGLFLVVVVWLADIERSSRIAVGAIEIDRRLTLAEDAIGRLERLESGATKVAESLGSLTAEAREASAELKKLAERESLRAWAMVTPTGMRPVSALGGPGVRGGPLSELSEKAFKQEREDGTGHAWVSYRCDAEGTKALEELRTQFPELPYAGCAIGTCLKMKSDPRWRGEVEQAVAQMEKLIAIEPHVRQLDEFWKKCSSLLAEP
jgi:hypothetical protein